MKTYNNSVVLRNDGTDPSTNNDDMNAGVGVNIAVRVASTPTAGQGALASIFDIADVVIANPMQTDNQGNYTFKVADGLYDIVIAEGTADETILASEEIVELVTPDFINNLSLPYVFDTVADYKAFATAFPVGKVIKLLDRGAEFTVVSGTGAANGIDIISSDAISQSATLTMLPIMTGEEFGIVSDFNESLATGTPNDAVFTRMMELSSTEGVIYKIKKGKYLFNTQQTITHGSIIDFSNSDVAMIQTSANNDSVFQMGNNTQLSNINRLLYKSASVSAFSTLGLIKIGEFYAEINGAPNSGDNSIDSSYWEVSDVSVSNIKGYSVLQPLNTDRNFTATVEIVGGSNIKTDGIFLNGLAGDGIPIEKQSVVRTETGFDPNVRRQGFNLLIDNTVGENLRAHPENAVVYINGDRNTKVTNVHGESCGQIFACNTSGSVTNQSPSLRGKNGVNIRAENVTGFDCKIYTGDTFSKLTAGVNIKATEPDLVTGNRSQIYIAGIHLQSTQTSGDKLSKGIAINDSSSSLIDTKRVTVQEFEVYYFPEGLIEDAGTEQSRLAQGYIHDCDGNGMTVRGIQSTYNNLKITNNNATLDTSATGFNGHGVGLQCKGSVFEECIFGDDTLTSGSERQLSSIQVSANDTRAVFRDCRFGNFKTGYNDINLRGGITGSEIYIDPRCKGQMRSIASSFPIAEDVPKVQAVVSSTGAGVFLKNCTSATPSPTGTFLITYDKTFSNHSNNRVSVDVVGAAGTSDTVSYGNSTASTIEIYTKTGGTATDLAFNLMVFGDYDTKI